MLTAFLSSLQLGYFLLWILLVRKLSFCHLQPKILTWSPFLFDLNTSHVYLGWHSCLYLVLFYYGKNTEHEIHLLKKITLSIQYSIANDRHSDIQQIF